MKRKLVAGLLFFLLSYWADAQSIRKNYNEMTPDERLAYKTAVFQLEDTIRQLGCLHYYHAQGGTDGDAHTADYLLPWHRWFQYNFEKLLKGAGTQNAASLTVPYWDWREEYHDSNMTWHDTTLLGAMNTPWNLRRYNYKTESAFYGGTAEAFVRPIMKQPGMTVASYTKFYDTLNSIHGALHGYVGSGMLELTSPSDPVFYLHHGFIDKLWQEWEDSRPNKLQQRSVITATTVPHNHGVETCTVNGFPVTNHFMTAHINPQNVINSRKQQFEVTAPLFESWYAYKKILVLDGLGEDHITSGTKNYCYVAWDKKDGSLKGKIYVGDLKRDSANRIVRDYKGGFVIGSNSHVNISTVESITFKPGFSTQPNAVLNAYISDKTCGFDQAVLAREETSSQPITTEESVAGSNWKIYPNPVHADLVYFGKTASTYSLHSLRGELIVSGKNADHLDINSCAKGIYLLRLENHIQKLVIQ